MERKTDTERQGKRIMKNTEDREREKDKRNREYTSRDKQRYIREIV